jgi:hypothetical protein
MLKGMLLGTLEWKWNSRKKPITPPGSSGSAFLLRTGSEFSLAPTRIREIAFENDYRNRDQAESPDRGVRHEDS